ncbi:cupin domain-containing protein [Brevibacterium sediminis]|uniref:Cupin domain-containing protein n=2 Tax=Brevibacterium sediminis TaxID=1857024 RepID=A0A5C4WZB9_9MICO|nr:cupin domain-containing protein [Brevibacterium sediminis]
MEPINTHVFPLSHEPIEDWQIIPPASAGGPDAVGSVGLEGPAASAGDSGTSSSVELEGPAASAEASVTTGFAELGTIGGAEYGLWEMSAGAMRDIEGDEVFLVISGTGRIEFDEPLRDPIELAPGSLVRLDDGMKTRWYIDGTPLRKLFIAPGEG